MFIAVIRSLFFTQFLLVGPVFYLNYRCNCIYVGL